MMGYKEWKKAQATHGTKQTTQPKPPKKSNYAMYAAFRFTFWFFMLITYCLVVPTLFALYARIMPDISMFGWFFMWIGIALGFLYLFIGFAFSFILLMPEARDEKLYTFKDLLVHILEHQ
jgi:hypothetical protein